MALKKTTPIIITSLVIIAFFLIDLLLIDYTYLSKFNHLASLSPLYSFYTPMLSWRLLAPIAAGALFIAFLARTEKQSLKVNIVGFVVFMIAIRACFYYLRHDFSAMSQELFPYPAEAMISDTSVIGRMGLFSFLSAYPDLMPQLSLHGSHFPPGHSVLLYLLMSVFGENPHAVGWALIVLSSSILSISPFQPWTQSTEKNYGSLRAPPLECAPSSASPLCLWDFSFLFCTSYVI